MFHISFMLSHSPLSPTSRFIRKSICGVCVCLIQSRSSFICCDLGAFHKHSISVALWSSQVEQYERFEIGQIHSLIEWVGRLALWEVEPSETKAHYSPHMSPFIAYPWMLWLWPARTFSFTKCLHSVNYQAAAAAECESHTQTSFVSMRKSKRWCPPGALRSCVKL